MLCVIGIWYLWVWTFKKRKHLNVLILLKAEMPNSLFGNTKQGKLPILHYTLSISQPNDGDFNVCECASDRIRVWVYVCVYNSNFDTKKKYDEPYHDSVR